MKTLVINLYGGPGCGKSTIAAGLFFKLKCLGIDCELTGEFAKERVWDDNLTVLNHQPYIVGNQVHRLWILNNKVDVIICDSPILLPIIYSKENSEIFDNFVVAQYKKYNNIDFYIRRNNYDFNINGRAHNLEQSIQKDNEILEVFKRYNIDFIDINEENSEKIVNKIFEYLTVNNLINI